MRQFSYRPAAVRPCRRPQASALPHAWKTTSVLLALFAAAPHLGGQNAGTHYAIVVGVSDYAHEGLGLLKFAREDAERFADQIRATHGAAVEQVSVLLDREATRTRLLDRLREILTIRARPGDSVFLFFSARGLTSTVSKRGFIMGYESSPERPPTGLQIEDLRRMIRQSDAEQVLLFADVCREPNPPTTRNLINSRLSELDSDPKVAGLLASQPKQVSQALPERERGAFGYYLVEGLKRPASVKNGLVAADLGPLYQYVHANVHRATARKQSPYLFGERSLTRGRQTWRGRAVAAYLPPRRQLHALERAGSDSASVSAVSYYPKSRRHSFWRLGLLGLLAQSAPPTPRQAFDRAIADGRLLGPRGAWEIYERNPASGFEVGDLNRLAIALTARGGSRTVKQEVINLFYGNGTA